MTQTGARGRATLAMLAAVAELAALPVSAGAQAPVETKTVDAAGAVTVRAVRLDAPLDVDGALDEAIYQRIRPATDFILVEPRPGALASDQTEVWVMFDDTNIYVAARLHDADGNIVGTEMRRDNNNTWNGQDMVAFAFDTFLDRRNSVALIVNAIGGKQDGQVANESQYNGDWNPIWDPVVGRFDGGWTVEAAIPFKSLRYGPGTAQTWGFNVLRPSRTANEISFLKEMPAARGQQGLNMASTFATLVGLEAPPSSRMIEVKPYVTAGATTDVPSSTDEVTGDIGLDAKIGLTEGLTADLTVNTDFAQVEADEAQVNLTRFSLFFPEKREFFLENAGTFSFGGVALNGGGANGGTPVLFYSRSIGLEAGQAVPLRAGGRVTGRMGPFTLGVVNIQADEVDDTATPSTNFSVVRVKRGILRRSEVGVLATARSVDRHGGGASYTYGVDGTFGFSDTVAINTYWARTQNEGVSGDDTSYRAQFEYNADRYGLELERLVVEEQFNPEMGFIRRGDMRRTFAEARFSPRPAGLAAVRQFNWTASVNYIESNAGVLETREQSAAFQTEFVNNDSVTLTYTGSYEFLPQPFRIASGVTLPVGGYDFDDVQVQWNMAQQRPIRATLSASRGTFYSGHKTSVGASGGRVRVSNQMSLEPSYSINQVDLAEGAFTTHLVNMRATYTMTPAMFVSALVQYSSSSDTVSTNARLRWEYQPGSELFVVYNEQRDTLDARFPGLVNRALIVKFNRLFRL